MNIFDQDTLDLAAGISADKLANMQRRMRYLEAALAQVTGQDNSLREWFPAAELVSYQLPGLPVTASGLIRHAKAHKWDYRIAEGLRGERIEYHFTSLPQQAFNEMLERVLRNAKTTYEISSLVPTIPRPAKIRRPSQKTDPTPQWLLPLMRILREKPISVGHAMKMLPADAVTGERPDIQEVVNTLKKLGMLA
ncbi:hypothetical protein CSR02_00020 [Acetobacter pomorum]|uniref:HTH Mu-type domain-containing protein n=1 Tax=Acetobacter pomorum TaxID=65959 RepID=A0A2G4RG66_9PROT|nr:DNA-binding protein [Acetobacter pomorum]PHY95566.1 hypothetical protein CSR02_00020 [Acetobacter pomorum]GBR50046.1 hypothetical protein AA11825_1552 [Acetobacter pomorum DSM 11825]